jgi:hypothetical protein
MESLLTLVIALGSIVTAVGAIWAAAVARRQARVTERSLAHTERSFREQNERARLSLELDLILRLDERFTSHHLLASRRTAAKHIRECFVVNAQLLDVREDNRAAWEVQNFFEGLAYLVNLGAVRLELAWNTFGQYSQAYWTLYKPVIEKNRVEMGEPHLYKEWEQLCCLMVDFSRQQGAKEDFTKAELLRFVEMECFVGEEPPTQD